MPLITPVELKYCDADFIYETLLAVGVVGLLLLMLYLLMPLLCAVRRKDVFWQALFLTGILLFNLLFESMLERQMGLLFIGYLLPLLVLIPRRTP